MRYWGASVGLLALGSICFGAEPKTAVERGKEALLGRSFSPPLMGQRDYDNLWKAWGLKERPADFERRLRERYGLFDAPYPNHGLPMGLRPATALLTKGIGSDCLMCHAGSIAGQTVIGLGNASLDLQLFFDEMLGVQGMQGSIPIPFSHVRGTTEASTSVIYLYQFRDDDLNVRSPRKLKMPASTCEDVPAWWHLKKKKTMYHNASFSARAVRPLMSFMLSPLNSGAYIKSQEATFKDIQAYLLSLEAPKYPFPIDTKKATAGKVIFEKTCSRCHGTYGPDGEYPNKVIELDVIGTDRNLAEASYANGEEIFNRGWFAQGKGPDGKLLQAHAQRGYQAPPLDGIWATAPYFHNGSAPTVYHVLNSKARPKIFTRSYRTGKEDYDPVRLGWKITVLQRGPDPKLPAIERRKVYDTTQPGRGNGGHPFGDKLTETERMAVIEYLKTL
jgi:mono/diheme cytochrome c family protein